MNVEKALVGARNGWKMNLRDYMRAEHSELISKQTVAYRRWQSATSRRSADAAPAYAALQVVETQRGEIERAWRLEHGQSAHRMLGTPPLHLV